MDPVLGSILEFIGIIIFGIFIYKAIFGCFHEWEYLREWGITYQQKRCKKCGKLKIVSQD